MAVVLD